MYNNVSKFNKILLIIAITLVIGTIIYSLIGRGPSWLGLVLVISCIVVFVSLFPILGSRNGIIKQLYKKPSNPEKNQTLEELFHKEILQNEIDKVKK